MVAQVRNTVALAGLLLAGVLAHLAAADRLTHLPRRDATVEMQVALPLFVQVAVSAGDRYLAANVADFRALVASTQQMNGDNFRIQGIVQRDAVWLNPAHEDNYYIAAAILPWYGQLPAAQEVLKRAADGRPFDWQPMFYYAFNLYYFNHDPITAAEWLRKAAPRASSENDKYVLETIAASWYEKGYKPGVALKVIETMAANARSGGVRKYLLQRAERLRALQTLQDAAARYQAMTGKPLRSLQELLDARLVSAIPVDPFGLGYDVDARGNPIFRRTPSSPSQ